MIQKIIELSLKNRYIVLLMVAGLFFWGIAAVKENPIDAIPDLSENQVIVFTEWMGRGPQIIEDQVTYPLVSNLQGIPDVKNIRGTSMFGMSFVYVIFEDGVDIYWARTRVMERLNYAQRLLPEDVTPTLGPDGTGVGHIYWYHLEAPNIDLGEQRALQDWYIKLALQTVPGVAEVASFGGHEKQYQLVIDPVKLQYYNVSLMDVMNKVQANNNDVGGRKFEMADMAYIIRAYDQRTEHFSGLIKTMESEPSYAPNEEELSIPSLKKMLAGFRASNKQLNTAISGINKARNKRNKLLYAPKTGLYAITLAVKTYVLSVYTADSPEYRQLTRLEFMVIQ